MTARARANSIPAGLLAGRTAVIAGGTGSVGGVVVDAFLRAGATVVVPSRTQEQLERLRSSLGDPAEGRLITLPGDLSDEADGPRLRDRILEEAGPLDAAVASLGGFVAAPSVLEAPLPDLKHALDGYLLAHFMVAKALLPALEERSGSYTFINGPLAFRPMFPGTGLVSIATAGQAMLARLIMEEQSGGPVRINEVVLYTRFGWDAEEKGGAVPQTAVARYLAHLASEQGAGVRGETIHLNSLDPLGAVGAC